MLMMFIIASVPINHFITLCYIWIIFFSSSWGDDGYFTNASPILHVDYPLPQVVVNYGYPMHDQNNQQYPNNVVDSKDSSSVRAVDVSRTDEKQHHEWHKRRSLQQQTTTKSITNQTMEKYPPNAIFEPIRIHFITDAIKSKWGQSDAINAEIHHIVEDILPILAAQWKEVLMVQPMVGGRNYTAADSCLGNVLQGKVRDQYIEGADLVIFVSGEDNLGDGGPRTDMCTNTRTAAAATPCLTDQWDRPITGSMNFCLGKGNIWVNDFPNSVQEQVMHFTGMNLQASYIYPNMIRILMHEIAHVLGMNELLFFHFREPDGTPRTPRPIPYGPHPCVSGYVFRGIMDDDFPANNTIQLIQSPDGNSTSYYIVTPRVQQVVRNYFNCPDLIGARLETQSGCIGSHWHERQYYGELLSSQYSRSSENALSALTLALLEDTGWYRVNYEIAETTVFGIGSGCLFDQGQCIINDQVPSYGTGAFCSNPIRLSDSDNNAIGIGCDPGYRQWTLCDLYDVSNPDDAITTEAPIHYFTNPNLVSSFIFADSCPVPDFALGFDCTQINPEYTSFYSMETTGPDSRCFQASQYYPNSNRTVHRPACLRVQCDAENGVIRISDGQNELICEHDGQVLQIPTLIGGIANLQCPKLAALCPKLFSCPSACSGRGTCVVGKNSVASCHCFPNESTTGAGCYPLYDGKPFPMISSSAPEMTPITTPTILEFAPTTTQATSIPEPRQHEVVSNQNAVAHPLFAMLLVAASAGFFLVFLLYRRRTYAYGTVSSTVNQDPTAENRPIV